MLEIHDELAAQIANSTEEVEYIDGVSSIDEEDEDEDAKTITSEKKDKKEEEEEEEEVQVDTFRVIGVRRQQGECLVRTRVIGEEGGNAATSTVLLQLILIRRAGLLYL